MLSETNLNDLVFLELIGRFEFDFRRRGKFFEKTYSIFCVFGVHSHAM